MKITNENFIKYLNKKEEKALEYVVDTYGGLIKSIVNKHLYGLKDYHDECINDILLAIWEGIDKYDNDKGQFKSWLAAVSKYKCIAYKRKYLNQDKEDYDSLEFISEDNIKKKIEILEIEEEINYQFFIR